MISDPIEIDPSDCDALAHNNPTEEAPVFWISKSEGMIGLASSTREDFWSVARNQAYYDLDGKAISREEFITGIRERYPDYFEWFLFHPEWL